MEALFERRGNFAAWEVATVTYHNRICQLNMNFLKFDADIQTFTIQRFESFER